MHKIRQEEKRLAAGWTYEPPTFYERNEAVTDNPAAKLCHYAVPPQSPQPVAAVTPRAKRRDVAVVG